MTTDEILLAYAESVSTLAEVVARSVTELASAMSRLEDAVRALPAPVVNVAPAPAPEVHVEAARALPPTVQEIRIVGLPPLKARVKRDPMDRIVGIEE